MHNQTGHPVLYGDEGFYIVKVFKRADVSNLEQLDECDPLVVGRPGGVLLALHVLQVGYALHVRLVLRRDVRRAVDPAEILCRLAIDSL